jgi:hypothetical protein
MHFAQTESGVRSMVHDCKHPLLELAGKPSSLASMSVFQAFASIAPGIPLNSPTIMNHKKSIPDLSIYIRENLFGTLWLMSLVAGESCSRKKQSENRSAKQNVLGETRPGGSRNSDRRCNTGELD